MKQRSMLVPVLLAMLLVAGTALAGPEERAAGRCGQCEMHGAGGAGVGKHGRGLGPDLTDEQRQTISELRMAHLKKVRPMETEVELKQMELGALWRADELDGKAIIAKVKEIAELRTKIQIARVQHRIDAYNQLTPEQRAKAGRFRGMKGMRRCGRGRLRGPRPMGMPGPQGPRPESGCCPPAPPPEGD